MDERSRSTFHRRGDAREAKTAEGGAASVAVTRRLKEILRGGIYAGIAFLLSGCRLWFGTFPLGVALLCASSSGTWYILAGLTIGTLWGIFDGVAWVWIGVYALAILLRLGIQFFVEPPDLIPEDRDPGGSGGSHRPADDRPSNNHRGYGSIARQWAALKALLAHGRIRGEEAAEDAYSSAPPVMPSVIPSEIPTPTSATTAAAAAAAVSDGKKDPRGRSDRPAHRQLFRETPLLRVFTGAVCGFAAGLCGILQGGFAFYDLFAALFLTVTVPLAVAGLIPCFRPAGQAAGWISVLGARRSEDAPAGGLASALSLGGLLLATIYAARGYVGYLGTPYVTLRLAPLLALLLTLGMTARGGLTAGMMAAVVGGLGADPFLTPGLVLGALICVALRMVSARVGAAGGCVVFLLWCAVLGGHMDVVNYLFTCLLAIPLHLLAERLYEGSVPTATRRTAEMEDFWETAVRETREVDRNTRIKALSEAFSSLSRLFYDMSDRLRRPRVSDMHRVCETAVTEQCAGCAQRETCRETYRDLPEAMAAHLAVYLRTHRIVTPEALPPALRAACPHTEGMVTAVNALSGVLTEKCVKGERTEIFAADYEAMSAILTQIVSETDTPVGKAPVEDGGGEDDPCDHQAAERMAARLTEQGLTVDGVVICGRRERHVVVRGARLECLSETQLTAAKTAMEEICGVRLSEPTFDVRGGHTVMRLAAEPELMVSFAGSTVPIGTAAVDRLPAPLTDQTPPGAYVPPYVCGDHIALFSGDRAYFYALISDGMGSGEEASLTSDITTIFLERMLSAGSRPETALAMLGSFLRQKNTGTGSECSATVDLMALDLFDGDAVFFKNGAAPTYVIRGGTVYKLRSRTMPLGILKDAPADALRFRTHPGDVVVMVSDGVTHGNDECPWLIDLLSAPLPPNMDALRLNILNHAIASGSPDDMSAIALRVEEK